MKPLPPVVQLSICAALALSLSACGSSQWRNHADAAARASQQSDAASLQKAEAEYRQAVKLGEKECATDKEYSVAIVGLGETLLHEGKFEESQWYLVRGLQMGTAVDMPFDENIRLLKELVTAYEGTRNYEEALSTQNVLLNLLAVEQSPSRPQFAQEAQYRDRIKTKLAAVTPKAPSSAGVAQ